MAVDREQHRRDVEDWWGGRGSFIAAGIVVVIAGLLIVQLILGWL